MNAMKHGLLLAAMTVALPVTAAAQSSQAQVAEGSKAWARNCTRCHNARPSTERTDRQWATIVAHMRARANLTKSDAELVAVFLKATNGPPVVVAAQPVAAPVAKPRPEPEEEQNPEPEAEPEGSGAPAPDAPADAITLPDGTTITALQVAALARYLRTLTFP